MEGGENGALVAETHLFLRGVHVDVDKLGVDAYVDHGNRMAAALQAALVALLERVHERSRADRPAVDREHHPVAAAAAEARLAHHAFHERHADHLEHLGRDRSAVDGSDRAPLVTVAVGAERRAAVDREVKANMRVQHCERAHHVFDRGHLGGIAFQKLQARRHVGE